MTPHITENGSIWLVNCTLVSNWLPPRNPNDEEDEEDEEDEDKDEEPAVIREPDE